MKLSKFLISMAFVTLLALVYIHLQLMTFNLAYNGKDKENQIRKLVNANGNLRYTILTLKSANNIGLTMLSEDSNMDFADPQMVVQLPSPNEIARHGNIDHQPATRQKSGLILSLLTLGSQAEAKISRNTNTLLGRDLE